MPEVAYFYSATLAYFYSALDIGLLKATVTRRNLAATPVKWNGRHGRSNS